MYFVLEGQRLWEKGKPLDEGWEKGPKPVSGDLETGTGGRESLSLAGSYLMKGRSRARSAFTYHVACTTTKARRFFRSLKNMMRSSTTRTKDLELPSLLSILDFSGDWYECPIPLTAPPYLALHTSHLKTILQDCSLLPLCQGAFGTFFHSQDCL